MVLVMTPQDGSRRARRGRGEDPEVCQDATEGRRRSSASIWSCSAEFLSNLSKSVSRATWVCCGTWPCLLLGTLRTTLTEETSSAFTSKISGQRRKLFITIRKYRFMGGFYVMDSLNIASLCKVEKNKENWKKKVEVCSRDARYISIHVGIGLMSRTVLITT